MSKIPGDNGSSLNILITLKIIALTNITLIETSVLAVYPDVCFCDGLCLVGTGR
jgi:hypothetical protein